jgi:hypothetical protein
MSAHKSVPHLLSQCVWQNTYLSTIAYFATDVSYTCKMFMKLRPGKSCLHSRIPQRPLVPAGSARGLSGVETMKDV